MEQSGEIDEEVHLMMRSMLVPAEEIKLWHKEQRSDPVLAELIRRREEKQDARKEFEFTPQGLLVRLQDGKRKVMVPVSLRQRVLKSCHDDPTVGHIGIHRTLEIVQRTYSWKKMGEDIKAYVRSCPTCQMMKLDHRK